MDNLRKSQAAPPLGTAPRELVLGQSGGAYGAIPIGLVGENAPFVARGAVIPPSTAPKFEAPHYESPHFGSIWRPTAM